MAGAVWDEQSKGWETTTEHMPPKTKTFSGTASIGHDIDFPLYRHNLMVGNWKSGKSFASIFLLFYLRAIDGATPVICLTSG